MRKINSLDVRSLAVDRVGFLTLTYPCFFVDPITSKKHLKEFLRRLQRLFGRVPLIWKMEPQRRGAPHFHLMLFASSSQQLQQLRSWAPVEWHDIAGHQDPRHLAWHLGQLGNGNKHCLQPIESWRAVKAYVPKYMGKVTGINSEEWAFPGRWWGSRFDEDLRRSPVQRDLSQAKTKLARRLMRHWYQKQPSGRFRAVDPDNGRVFREYLKPAAVDQWRSLGYVVTPINRRWNSSRGGMTIYAPAALGRSILAWIAQLGADVDSGADPPRAVEDPWSV